MAAPNLTNITTITGKTATQSIGTSASAIVTNSAASGKVYKINSLVVANIDGSNAADITADLYRSSTAYKMTSTIAVPANSTLVIITKETGIYLEEGDSLRLTASATGDLTAICSYEEIS